MISVLKKWAERHYYDFRFPEMITAFQEFMDDINASDCAKYGGQIKSILDAEVERAKTFKEAEKIVIPLEIQRTLNGVDFVANWSPKRIAQELTIADLKLFRQIKPDEFCIFLWGEKKDTRIANFNAYIDRFNRIGFWVGTVVCAQKDIKRRVEAVEKFIQIMKYVHKFSNYGTLMAIISGLNTTAVSRLKKTWEIVNKGRHISTYKDLEAKMSYRGNFKAYREIEATSKPPFIPFFGLYVKDLTFMNDGNQKIIAAKAQPESVKNSVNTMVVSPADSGVSGATPSSLAPSSILKAAEGENNESSTSLATKSSGPTPALAEEKEAPPPLAPMINFEKCRTISDKIHAIRVYQ